MTFRSSHRSISIWGKKQQGHIRLQALRNQDGQLHFPLLTIMLRLKLITAHLLSADYMPIESAPMLYIFMSLMREKLRVLAVWTGGPRGVPLLPSVDKV